MEENLNEQETTEGNFLTQHIKGKYLVLSLVILFILIIILLGTVFLAKTEKVVENQTTQIPQITPTASPEISFVCPVISVFCGTGAYENNKLLLKPPTQLKEGDFLYAVFDGTVQEQIQPAGYEFKVMVLTNKTKELQAQYYFMGKIKEKIEVEKGDVIGVADGKNFGLSFMFNLFRRNSNGLGWDSIPVSKSLFAI